jgi:hypothetical protein
MSTTENTAAAESTATAEKIAKITVIQAVYGASSGDRNATKDVTVIVQRLVDRGITSFIADNKTFEGDPINTDKHFAVSYMVGSSRFAFACQEGQEVGLRTRELPRGPITVVGASYGAIDPRNPTMGARDVTAIVQELLDLNGSREVKFIPTNNLFGDPVTGPTKSFGMTYAPTGNLNQKKAIALRENQDVTVKV